MASGDTLAIFHVLQSEPPISAYATRDTRNDVEIRDFDDTTDESLEFTGLMPSYYAGGGVTATIFWMATSATSGAAVLTLAFKSVSDDADDLDTKAFAAANSVTATAPSASGEVDYADITFTDGADMDSVAASEMFRLEITRDADNASDTMTGDVELIMIALKET